MFKVRPSLPSPRGDKGLKSNEIPGDSVCPVVLAPFLLGVPASPSESAAT